MSNFLKILPIILIAFMLVSCSSEDKKNQECTPIDELFDPAVNGGKLKLKNNDITGNPDQGILTWIVAKITLILNDSSETMYQAIADDEEFRNIIGICVALAIMFYALAILLGMAQANGYELMIFTLKVVLVYNFAVNWDTFEKYVVDVFEAFVNDTVAFAGQTFHSSANLFNKSDHTGAGTIYGDMDSVLSMLWNIGMIKLALALISTSMVGAFYGLILLALIAWYLLAVVMAVKIYLLALIARYVLYALGPIFLTFALFKQTKSLFDGYIEQLINFSLQPVFLFIFLGLFHQLIVKFIEEIYIDTMLQQQKYFSTASGGSATVGACIKYACIDKESVGNDDCKRWYKICTNTDVVNQGGECVSPSGIDPAIPIDIWVVISCLLLCHLMYAMTEWVLIVASRLSSGYVTLSETKIEGYDKLESAAKQGVSKAGSAIWQSAGAKGTQPRSGNVGGG